MRTLIRIFVAAAAVTGMLLAATAGQAGGAPSIDWAPSTGGAFAYGLVGVGHTASQTFTLTNSGGSATAKLTITLSGSGAYTITANDCPGSLGPRKSCDVTVEYAPTTSGSFGATLDARERRTPRPRA